MTTEANICTRCRKPLEGPARKDRFGNAYCQPCVAAILEAEKRRDAKILAAGAAAAPAASPRSEPVLPVAPSSGPIPLEPEDTTVHIRKRICDKCSKTINADAVICPYCSYDPAQGLPENVARAHEAGPKCSKCGYSLVGLRTSICPECGTKNKLSHSRALSMEEASKESVRQAYKRPAIMLGVGLIGLALVTLIRGHPVDMAFILARYVLEVPVGLGAYVICCFLWIGFDMPLHLVAFRLAAIYAVVDLITGTADAISLFWIIPAVIAMITYVGLLMEELDLELQDAIILAVVTLFSKWAIMAILIVIAQHMGIRLMGM